MYLRRKCYSSLYDYDYNDYLYEKTFSDAYNYYYDYYTSRLFSDDEDYGKRGAAIGAGVGLGLTGAIGASAYLSDKKLRQRAGDALESAEKEIKSGGGRLTEDTMNKLGKVVNDYIYTNKRYMGAKDKESGAVIRNIYNDFLRNYAADNKSELKQVVTKKLGIDISKPDWLETVRKNTELSKKFDEEFTAEAKKRVDPIIDSIMEGKNKKGKGVFDYFIVRNSKDDLINNTLLSKIKRNKLATAGIAGAGITALGGVGYGLGKLKKKRD